MQISEYQYSGEARASGPHGEGGDHGNESRQPRGCHGHACLEGDDGELCRDEGFEVHDRESQSPGDEVSAARI